MPWERKAGATPRGQGMSLWTTCPPCPASAALAARSHPFTMVLFSGVTSASLTSAVAESLICFSPMSNVTFPSFCPSARSSPKLLFFFFFSQRFLQVRTTVLCLLGREGLAASRFQLKPMKELRREGKAVVWGSRGRNTAHLCKPDPFWCQFSLFPRRGQQGKGFCGDDLSPPQLLNRGLWLGRTGPATPAKMLLPVLPANWYFCFALPCLSLMLISVFIGETTFSGRL